MRDISRTRKELNGLHSFQLSTTNIVKLFERDGYTNVAEDRSKCRQLWLTYSTITSCHVGTMGLVCYINRYLYRTLAEFARAVNFSCVIASLCFPWTVQWYFHRCRLFLHFQSSRHVHTRCGPKCHLSSPGGDTHTVTVQYESVTFSRHSYSISDGPLYFMHVLLSPHGMRRHIVYCGDMH